MKWDKSSLPFTPYRGVMWIKRGRSGNLSMSVPLLKLHRKLPWAAPPWLPGDLLVTPASALAPTVSSGFLPPQDLNFRPPPRANEGGAGSGPEACTRVPCPAGRAGTRLSCPLRRWLSGTIVFLLRLGGGADQSPGGGAHTPARFWSARFSCLPPSTRWPTHLPGFVLSRQAYC